MADIITFSTESVDLDSAIGEIEVLIPKYLDALEKLEDVEHFEDVPVRLSNVMVYWGRISALFGQIGDLEEQVDFKKLKVNTLQSELTVLEDVYIMISEEVHGSPQKWSEAMWDAAELTLQRMDLILGEIGFEDDHEDRVLIREVMAGNYLKQNISNAD